ncbi:MAG TPA: efflux RND transporter periplasmic adaptor subunit [Candidatus Krumholzibacteria bacterium]|nr:efflux RND transporter periplasmic adaptor subunit [Candidatus Krumholzibacteria bacterium]
MAKRMIIVAGILIAVIGTIAFIKYRQISAAISQGSSYVPPPEAVTTVVAGEAQWAGALNAIGTAVAVNGVMISADLPGVVEEIAFESGHRVNKGDLLVRMDTRQEQAQLKAAEAQLDLANLNLERARGLFKQEAISKSDMDQIDAQARSAEANVEGYRATIGRKTMRAPFAGVLGIRQINVGQYLSGGDPVVALQAIDPIYVNFSLPQQDVASLRTGTAVNVMVEGVDGVAASGKITAINSVIDDQTRNIEVQATLPNRDGVLRPGMFVTVEIELGSATTVIALPASAVAYAPYGNSVYIVEDMPGPDGKTYKGVRQQFVKLGPGRGDQVAVMSGVKAGEEIVTSGVFKLRPGASVMVNNEIQPANSTDPKPEDS